MITTAKRELEGNRVRFSPLQMDNIYKQFEWNNDPELNRLDSELPYKAESFGTFKRRFEHLVYHPSMSGQDFEIHAENGDLIGVAEISGISEHNRHCTIGIIIGDRNYWGRGYGREAIEVVLEYCFDVLQMHRVMTEVFEFNSAWKRLVEGTGFRKEGTEREYVYREEQYWDKEIYAMLESEYRLRSQTNGKQKAA